MIGYIGLVTLVTEDDQGDSILKHAPFLSERAQS